MYPSWHNKRFPRYTRLRFRVDGFRAVNWGGRGGGVRARSEIRIRRVLGGGSPNTAV